jgi:N-methylhydantoinase A
VDRERLVSGSRFQGPAIVEEAGSTAVVPPGWRVEAHGSGALAAHDGTDGGTANRVFIRARA